jgi:hypothetical protein
MRINPVPLVLTIMLISCESRLSETKAKRNDSDLPEGWTIEYNDVTKQYRPCFPSGYCSVFEYGSRLEPWRELGANLSWKRPMLIGRRLIKANAHD